MASNTKKTKIKRKKKVTKQGKERKRIANNKGTTPKFPIHPEE